ncbi:MAG: DegT/DnrJ/EryC1/StrS family aminotransferase, partial [Gammaproteobacteria bacterium]
MTQGLPIQFIDLAAQQQRLGPGIQAAMARVLAHGNYILGPEVKELEQKLAEYSGARHVVSCASGTDALLMVLMAKGVQAGEAVFMPSFSFVSTAEVVALLGATPVFVDVEAEDFLMSPTSLEAAIQDALKKGLRPKVVIPVDLFGQPADYAAIGKLAKNYDLFVLADAAQSFGGARGDKRVGTLAPVTATSFFPAKPLGCYGDGGAIFTDDEALAQVLLSLRVHGQGQDKYDNVRIGINGRLDTLQAAILIEKLRLFPEEIEARQRVAARYTDGLEDIVKTPRVVPGTISAWAQYTLRLDGRDAVAARLKERGVPTAVYYPKPLHQQT